MHPHFERQSRRRSAAWLWTACAMTTLWLVGAASGTPNVRKLKTVRWLANHRYLAQISYPHLSGLPDGAVERRINAQLQAQYPAGGLEKHAREAAEGLESGEEVHLEASGRVTLLSGDVVSIRYVGLEMAVKKGRLNAAHPNNLNGAATIDLRTGKVYAPAQLFAGPHWRGRLDALIAKEAARQVPELARGLDGDGLLQQVREHHYHCWLTRGGVGVGEIFAGHAVEGVEVQLSLAQVRQLLNPKGPGRVFVR